MALHPKSHHSLVNGLTQRLLGLSLVGLVGVGGGIILSLVVTLQQVQHSLKSSSVTAARNIDPFFLELKGDLLATSTSLASSNDIKNRLRQIRFRNREVVLAQLQEPNGDILVETEWRQHSERIQLPDSVWLSLKGQVDQIYISPLYFKDNTPCVDMAAVATDALGISQQLLVIRVDLTELWGTSIDQQIGEPGDVYIVDEQGLIVATHSLTKLQKESFLGDLRDHSNRLRIHRGLDGNWVFSVVQPISLVPWFAIVEQPILEALEPFTWPAIIIFLILLIGSVMIMITVRFIRARLVMPLHIFSQGVEALTKGEFHRGIQIDQDDELGHLAAIFNEMASELKSNLEDLESRVRERTEQIRFVNRILGKEVIKHQETTFSLQHLLAGTTSTGPDFFPALVKHLAQALKVSHAIVTERIDDKLRTLAVWADGEFIANFSYVFIETPCGVVMTEGSFRCEQLVQPLFPNDLDLVEMGSESYLGVALEDTQHQFIGHLCVLNRDVIQDPERAEQILEAFAARAAAELERQRATALLEQLNQDLESTIENRTAELQIREAHYRALLEGAGDAIVVMDLDGYVMEVNRRAEELFDYSRTQLISMHYSHLHPEAIQQQISSVFQEIIQGQGTQILETQILRRKGSRVDVDISATLVTINESLIIQGIIRDASVRKQLERELRHNMEELQRINLIKDDFLSTVSHELRTPLTNIDMASRMLRITLEKLQIIHSSSSPQTEKIERYLKILEDQCRQEGELINDLLDLQRLNAGAYLLEPTQIRVSDWLDEITLGLAERAQQQEQIFEVSVTPNSAPIQTDVVVLRRVLSELLNNALKYTPAGERIELAVQIPDRRASGQNGRTGANGLVRQIVFDISNTGVEISTEEQEHLFEPFYRAVKDDRWSKRGTGLGLTLVKKFVSLLEGEISLRSGNNRTCFTVRIPLDYQAGSEYEAL